MVRRAVFNSFCWGSFLVSITFCACVGEPYGSSANANFASSIRELPPCHLPPLTDTEILIVAQKVLGEDYSPPGLPEPLRRIRPFRCLYIYEQSAYYFKGTPAPVDGVDTTFELWIARDRTYLR